MRVKLRWADMDQRRKRMLFLDIELSLHFKRRCGFLLISRASSPTPLPTSAPASLPTSARSCCLQTCSPPLILALGLGPTSRGRWLSLPFHSPPCLIQSKQ